MSQFQSLTVDQPWAWAICVGLQKIVNRPSTTTYRGPVAIHAGTSPGARDVFLARIAKRIADPPRLSTGAIIGVADLKSVVPLRPDLESDRFAVGPYCWLLANGRLFKRPVPLKGKTGFFQAPEAESAKIEAQAAHGGGNEHAPPTTVPELYLEPSQLQIERALAYLEAGRTDDALRCSSTAVRLSLVSGEAYRLRGAILGGMGRWKEAKADLDKAIQLDPKDARALLCRASLWEALGNHDNAKRDKQYALTLDPELAEEDQET